MNKIFIPKELTVGFKERSDTYTGKLAYVIYTDEKGVLRKEKSWNSWRDEDIEPLKTENIPTSGFVLNKKAGGYSTGWNHRQTYVRVYDARGFEFEISVANLLYILENTNSIKGKGLEGEFVYGWDGTELLLIPTSSPDYIEISEFNKVLHNKKNIKVKDLSIGATYRTKQNQTFIYMGRFDYYRYDSENKGKHHWFYNPKNECFEEMKTVSNKLIDIIDNNCTTEYLDIFDKLEGRETYSPIDYSKNEYINYDFDEFKKKIEDDYYWGVKCYSNGKNIKVYKDGNKVKFLDEKTEEKRVDRWGMTYHIDTRYREKKYDSIDELFNELKPQYVKIYLENGRLYREEK